MRRGLCPRGSSLRRCHQLRLLLGRCIPLLTKLLTSGRRLRNLNVGRHLMATHHRRHRSLRLTHDSLPASYRKDRLLLVLRLMLGTLLGRRRYRRRHRLGQDLLRDLLVMLSSNDNGGRRRRRRRSRGRRRRDDLLQKLLLLLLLLRLLIIRLRLRRMRYDRLTVLRLLLLLNKLRTLKYLHYLIAWAHYGILLNNRLRRRWPHLMPAGTRRRNDDAAAVTATTGRNQDLLTSTPACTTPVGTRNRTGTGNGTSHKGHGLALLVLLMLLLDMVLECFFRRFRAT